MTLAAQALNLLLGYRAEAPESQDPAPLRPAREPTWSDVGDFWNDPRRWDGIDPHKTCFWTIDRGPMPVYNVVEQRYQNPYANVPMGVWPSSVNMQDLLNAKPGSIIRYR